MATLSHVARLLTILVGVAGFLGHTSLRASAFQLPAPPMANHAGHSHHKSHDTKSPDAKATAPCPGICCAPIPLARVDGEPLRRLVKQAFPVGNMAMLPQRELAPEPGIPKTRT